MGILSSEWQADYAGHRLVVTRNELTKSFRLDWDGERIAKRWSWTGLGELRGTARLGGRDVLVNVMLVFPGSEHGMCIIHVDGQQIRVHRTK